MLVTSGISTGSPGTRHLLPLDGWFWQVLSSQFPSSQLIPNLKLSNISPASVWDHHMTGGILAHSGAELGYLRSWELRLTWKVCAKRAVTTILRLTTSRRQGKMVTVTERPQNETLSNALYLRLICGGATLCGTKLNVFYMQTTGANASLPRLAGVPGTMMLQSSGVAEGGPGRWDDGRKEGPS